MREVAKTDGKQVIRKKGESLFVLASASVYLSLLVEPSAVILSYNSSYVLQLKNLRVRI